VNFCPPTPATSQGWATLGAGTWRQAPHPRGRGANGSQSPTRVERVALRRFTAGGFSAVVELGAGNGEGIFAPDLSLVAGAAGSSAARRSRMRPTAKSMKAPVFTGSRRCPGKIRLAGTACGSASARTRTSRPSRKRSATRCHSQLHGGDSALVSGRSRTSVERQEKKAAFAAF